MNLDENTVTKVVGLIIGVGLAAAAIYVLRKAGVK